MAGRRSGGRTTRTDGFVLLGLLTLITLGTLSYFVGQLSTRDQDAMRQARSQQSLLAAREALFAYALRYRDVQAAQGQAGRMYGYLPMPDLGSTRNTNGPCNNLGIGTG